VACVLLADIGGTNSRFALAGSDGRPEHIRVHEHDASPDLEAAIAHYLDEVGARPDAAVLAVAGPIDGQEITLTNRGWRFHCGKLAQRFGLAGLRVVNDFEAIAWAIPRLDPADTRRLGGPNVSRPGIKVVLGPGTGLGVAALVPVGEGWQVIPSEGGHASFGPQRADEIEAFNRLFAEHGHVSAEMVISGPGLARLAHAIEPRAVRRSPEMVVADAFTGEPAALQAAELFVRFLGRFAGGLALTFKATGGVYLAGGVASRLGSLFDAEQFHAAFVAHPPYEALLKNIPCHMMRRTEPGLLGCAVLADEFATPTE
jgi:glucokinase